LSTAKRRVAVVPESPLNNTTYPIYDLDAALGGLQNGGGQAVEADPLAQFEADQDRQLIADLRKADMESKRVEMRQKLEAKKQEVVMKRGPDGVWSGKMPNLSAAEISDLSKKTPEEQQAFMRAYQLVQSMAAMPASGGQQNPLLTMMMATGGFGGGGGQKGLGVEEVLKISSMFNGIYNGAGRGDTDVTKQLLLNLMTTTLPQWQNQAIGNMQMAYQAQIAQLQQNQADPLRDLEYGKKLAESLGFKAQGGNAEIEKVRLDMEDRWKLKEFELKANQIQYERNLGLVNQILNNPLLTELAKTLARGVGGAAVATVNTAAVNPLANTQQPGLQDASKQSALVKYICPNPNCGAEIIAPLSQTQVTCTQCGGTYVVDPKATVDNLMKGQQR
jgi:DNA-directed RNA polymerase subunit RPC12/RpoP